MAAIFFRIVRENDALSLGAFPVAFPSEPAISIGIVLVKLPFVPGKALANHVGLFPDLLAFPVLFFASSDAFSEILYRGAFHNGTYPGKAVWPDLLRNSSYPLKKEYSTFHYESAHAKNQKHIEQKGSAQNGRCRYYSALDAEGRPKECKHKLPQRKSDH